jgi:transposase
MCVFFGVSRAAYYAWGKRIQKPDPDAERMSEVLNAYQASHKTYGYRRITYVLCAQRQLKINHKAVLRLMNKLGIRSVARRRKFIKKSDGIHRYSNHLDRDF